MLFEKTPLLGQALGYLRPWTSREPSRRRRPSSRSCPVLSCVTRAEGALDADNKNPARVVFRLCFGTSSEHLGQAGCFRLPVKACRPQPPLCVPESFNLRFECSSRWPRTGQGKFKFMPGKERSYLTAPFVPISGIIKVRQARNGPRPVVIRPVGTSALSGGWGLMSPPSGPILSATSTRTSK